MAEKIARDRLFFATAAFLAEMRKAHANVAPNEDCPVKNLVDYSPEHRSALMAAVNKAILMADPVSDEAYRLWKERRSAAKNQ